MLNLPCRCSRLQITPKQSSICIDDHSLKYFHCIGTLSFFQMESILQIHKSPIRTSTFLSSIKYHSSKLRAVFDSCMAAWYSFVTEANVRLFRVLPDSSLLRFVHLVRLDVDTLSFREIFAGVEDDSENWILLLAWLRHAIRSDSLARVFKLIFVVWSLSHIECTSVLVLWLSVMNNQVHFTLYFTKRSKLKHHVRLQLNGRVPMRHSDLSPCLCPTVLYIESLIFAMVNYKVAPWNFNIITVETDIYLIIRCLTSKDNFIVLSTTLPSDYPLRSYHKSLFHLEVRLFVGRDLNHSDR